mmetsp:Transcript_88129/g.221839  ORF Transcript_88129/g.221839 Transcript_88129/m.221839 type:complete len:216 (-) Transcript_88129:2554-3201(-)
MPSWLLITSDISCNICASSKGSCNSRASGPLLCTSFIMKEANGIAFFKSCFGNAFMLSASLMERMKSFCLGQFCSSNSMSCSNFSTSCCHWLYPLATNATAREGFGGGASAWAPFFFFFFGDFTLSNFRRKARRVACSVSYCLKRTGSGSFSGCGQACSTTSESLPRTFLHKCSQKCGAMGDKITVCTSRMRLMTSACTSPFVKILYCDRRFSMS